MNDLANITGGDAIAAAGVSRGEASEWNRRGYLNIPPANPAGRAARRYSIINVYELAIMKALVGTNAINLGHAHASEVIRHRLRVALGHDFSKFVDRPLDRPERLNNPRALSGTEFAHNPLEVSVWWVISPIPDSAGVVQSTFDGGGGVGAAVERQMKSADDKMLVFSLTRTLSRVRHRFTQSMRDELSALRLGHEDDDAGWTGR